MATRYHTGEFMEEDWHLFMNENFTNIGEDMTAVEDRVETIETQIDNDLLPMVGHDHTGETIAPMEISGEVADGFTITNLVGDNLGVDGNGELYAIFDGETAVPETHGNEVHDPNFALQSDHSTLRTDHDTLRSDFDAHDHDADYAPASVEADLTTLRDDFDTHDHDTEYVSADSTAADIGAVPQVDFDAHVDNQEAHHVRFSRHEARQAVDGQDISVQFWDGYELVFDDESPETNQYIRLETA